MDRSRRACRAWRGPRLLLPLLGLLALLAAPSAAAKGEPKVVEEPDGEYVHLFLEGDPAAQGWLWRGTGNETPAQPVDLIVGLHGAGGNPKNFVMAPVLHDRGAWCLVVAGHQSVVAEGRPGFMWDGANVSYITAFVRHLLATKPIAKDRVIVWGHSAGGSMTLATLAAAPELFAGGLTTASPMTPDTRHEDQRVFVLLGTKDPNWSGAPAVRAHVERFEKKKGKGACAFFAVEELGHDVPEDDYLALGFDWVLQKGARGGEATVPLRALGTAGPWRHILVRHKGAESAGDCKRSKGAAEKVLKDVHKALEKGRAWFRLEAARASEDADTASGGGGIDAEALRALLGTLPDLEPGTVSDVLPSPQGLHLVWRDAEEPSEGDGEGS